MCMIDYLSENRDTHFKIEDFNEDWQKKGPPNTATTRLVIHKNENEELKRKLEILHVHDTTHLPDELLNIPR